MKMNNYYDQNSKYPTANYMNNQNSELKNYQYNSDKDVNKYIENEIRLNIGKSAVFHLSFPDSIIERDKVFYGRISDVGRDHVMLHDAKTNKLLLLPLIYLNYIEFVD